MPKGSGGKASRPHSAQDGVSVVLNFLCGKCSRKFAHLAVARSLRTIFAPKSCRTLFSPKSCKKERVFRTFGLNCLRFIVPLGEEQ